MFASSSLLVRNRDTDRAERAARRPDVETAEHGPRKKEHVPATRVLRTRRSRRALFIAFLACASCSGDDDPAGNPGGNGALDAGRDTSGGNPDAGESDGGARADGTGAGDAPTTSDVPATSDAARDIAPVDRTTDTANPPPSDVQNDRAADANADSTGTVDASGDLGRADQAADASTSDVALDAPVPPPDAPVSCSLCASYGAAAQAGRITTSSLNALSGIGASLRNAGVVYVHNDRNVAQFSAVSEAGTLLGTFNVTGVTVDDIEDMAVAHCPAGTCVYIADVGGNISPRTQFAVIRAPEPQVDVNAPGGTTSIAGERLVFSYPDGANHNAESILVDPRSDTIYVITKVAAGMPSAVYKFPATFGGSALTATKVVDLTVPKSTDREATSASAHPCEPAFLLRTYNTLYEFRAAPGASLEAAFAATPVVVPVATETQGEGVTYRADGRGYLTTTEGSQPALNRVGCP
jgi:hypothetical protein